MDARWAWEFGLGYGAWYPELDADLQTILRGFADYANEPLNEQTVAHGRRVFRIHRWGKISTEQLRTLEPYLGELGAFSAQALEAALYYRRDVVSKGGADPRVEHPRKRGLGDFAPAVSRFLDANPDLKIYSKARVTPEPTNAPAPAPAPVSAATQEQSAPAPARQATPEPAPVSPRPAAPQPQPYGVSHAGAEAFVAAWMKHLGATRVRVTKVSGDGGIDVESRTFIAQVKNLAPASAVPIAAIRDLAGVASIDSEGRRAAMFTSGTFTSGGIEFANRARIALFRYDALKGTLSAINEIARHARRDGLE